ncbi:MAG: hypothetical protein FJ088_10160, partial [Deltaproteobacteria bacterium]|nr:hypothetical protein [Deltaproteobacteria bacterium]
KNYFAPGSEFANVFNLVMALGIVKALYHISGDPEVEEFLYKELMGNRKYLDKVVEAESSKEVDYIFMGVKTNFSNVNMIAIALFLNVFYENDPEVLAIMRDFMEKRWWDSEGVLQSVVNLKQPYFHALYLAMTDKGTKKEIVDEAAALLGAFSLEPYLNEERINCDEDELKAKKCLAIDGKTELIIQPNTNRGGWPVAYEALDPSIRPPSDFNARTDPFEVNGGGGKRINPGGDLHAAYWLLRYLDWMETGDAAVSQFARKHMPVGGYTDIPEEFEADTVEPADDITDVAEIVPETVEKKGGGCEIGHGSLISAFLLIFSLLVFFRIRRSGIPSATRSMK